MLCMSGGLSCIISLCHDFKLWGPHAFTCIMYIEILPRVSYRIYVRHDIMQALPLHGVWRRSRLVSTYTSTSCGSMCACMGRVWGSTTHPTLPRLEGGT